MHTCSLIIIIGYLYNRTADNHRFKRGLDKPFLTPSLSVRSSRANGGGSNKIKALFYLVEFATDVSSFVVIAHTPSRIKENGLEFPN